MAMKELDFIEIEDLLKQVDRQLKEFDKQLNEEEE